MFIVFRSQLFIVCSWFERLSELPVQTQLFGNEQGFFVVSAEGVSLPFGSEPGDTARPD